MKPTAVPTRVSPTRYLSAAWFVTLLALCVFLWCAYDSYRRFTDTVERNLRIEELRGRIIHLDEVLTMSARLFALTADPTWEDRYQQDEPKLQAAIQEALSFSLGARPTEETNRANEALVALETQAFEQARQGKLAEAKAALFSEQYKAQKAVYNDGMVSWAFN